MNPILARQLIKRKAKDAQATRAQHPRLRLLDPTVPILPTADSTLPVYDGPKLVVKDQAGREIIL